MAGIIYCVCREASLPTCSKCKKAAAIGATVIKKHPPWPRQEWPDK